MNETQILERAYLDLLKELAVTDDQTEIDALDKKLETAFDALMQNYEEAGCEECAASLRN